MYNKLITELGYQRGAYPALIRITYADGSVGYDSATGFDSAADLMRSVRALERLQAAGKPLASTGQAIVHLDVIHGGQAAGGAS